MVNGLVDGFVAITLPQEGRLALVGDADGGDALTGDAGGFQRSSGGVDDTLPDLFRVVLNPARLREMLLELDVVPPERCRSCP